MQLDRHGTFKMCCRKVWRFESSPIYHCQRKRELVVARTVVANFILLVMVAAALTVLLVGLSILDNQGSEPDGKASALNSVVIGGSIPSLPTFGCVSQW